MTIRIPAMDCAAEESEIRRALDSIPGIQGLTFQFGARTLAISAPSDVMEEAVTAIKRAGFDAQPVSPATESANTRPVKANVGSSEFAKPAIALVLAIGAEALTFWSGGGIAIRGTEMALAAVAILLAGFDTYRKGFKSLVHGRLNITALMSVAVTGAFLIGQWPEAAMVMALYAIAELIEARSLDRARNAIRNLMELAPEHADLQQPDGSWKSTPAADVPIEGLVRIRPGERVPLDGVITVGTSAINQAPVTGESIPVDKAVGDPVFAGTINQTGELTIRVSAVANNSTLARIIHSVESAQGTRAPTQRFVDRFAAVYTPAIFALAVAVAMLSPWLMGWSWSQSLYKSLVLLVIGCPCALVISTPVTVVSALASAARRGILIKGGTYLEQARLLKAIALDKTGTITEGTPRLVDSALVGDKGDPSTLAIAAGLAARSDHPVSKAISEGLNLESPPVQNLRALAGRGVQGEVDGESYVLGNHRLIEERGQCSAQLEAQFQAHEASGRTVTLLASDKAVLAQFAVADTIKESSRTAIAELKVLGVVPVMLTGDNPQTAQTISTQAGIEDARGNLLPDDKVAAVEDLQQRHGLTAMVGDGINDSPALSRADIGIAMGGAGTDAAMEAADVVIMNDDLRRIPELIRLSRKAHGVLWQNITLAIGIKAVFLFLALFSGATMWMAVFADMGAALLVVANGLRLLHVSSKSPAHSD
jgi:Cd2+/Zn2+-exporting ATPase